MDKQHTLRHFQEIPGVGKTVAQDLWSLGVRKISELEGRDPELLYAQLCAIQGMPIDRCMLYTLRCAVYYASNQNHDPELLKWWNWSDKNLKSQNVKLNAKSQRVKPG